MRVSIFGLGYVGSVSAACLADSGHEVVGVDVNPRKLELICGGRSPVVEPRLDDLMRRAVGSRRLRVTLDSALAVAESDVSLICVGTPSQGNGNLDCGYVESVCRQIGEAVARKTSPHTIVLRSTVLPGTADGRLRPVLEATSGRAVGQDLGLAVNPEFLREGTAVQDYHQPSYIVIGAGDETSGAVVERLYQAVAAPIIRTSIPVAEMLKYASNAWHATKVAFANEIGRVCKAQGIDGRDVMDLVCQDRQLNISPAYLTPGFAFGGSCLPKDLRALLYRAKERDLDTPLLGAVLASNRQQVELGIRLVERTGRKRIGVLGLSFKADTDDVRESPVVALVETLVGKGYRVAVYDERVEPSRLMGANRAFLEQEIPHIAALLHPTIEDVVGQSEVVVVANGSATFRQVGDQLTASQTLIDLVGLAPPKGAAPGAYEGICW